MSFGPDSEELREILTAYGRLQAAFFDDTARVFMELSLTMAQFRALTTIRRFGTMSGRELAGRLKVTPGTLVPLIDRLEEQGYVRRVPDLDDRRLTWVELTPKGTRLFQRLWLTGPTRMLITLSRMPSADRAHLKRLLNVLAVDLESKAEAHHRESAGHPIGRPSVAVH
ncbi:MAG TPA: MarR family transcriptional regulator [Candidatus Dormibacteraeota bacterium]|nr:MarR family transcriptional regulator [Candidatus Dormibacteraeota bacterium]